MIRGVQSARRLLRDHSKGTAQSKKRAIRWARVWTMNEVARELHTEKFNNIMAALTKDSRPGSQAYLSSFRTGEKKLVGKLTSAEKAQCRKTMNEWNKEAAPRHIQLKAFAKDKGKPFEKFSRDIFRVYGIRVVVLGTFLDKSDKIAHLM